MHTPPALGSGSRIAIVAPASPFERDSFDRGVAELVALGFEPVYDESVFDRDGYVAGTPETRAAALVEAWRNPAIDGIIAVRGGYGSAHLLPMLDPDLVRTHPKVFLGYSDLTTLQVWQTQRAGVVAFQGPMLDGRLARGPEGYDRDALLAVIARPMPAGEIQDDLETIRPGEAGGPVFGGTLTQLAASLGGPWAFDPPPGHVLFLEDVGERPYRLDRLVTQLRHAGILARAAAVVLGTFPGCDEPGGAFSARGTLARLFAGFPGPVVFGARIGHVEGPALTLPIGVAGRVVAAGRGRLIVDEAAVC